MLQVTRDNSFSFVVSTSSFASLTSDKFYKNNLIMWKELKSHSVGLFYVLDKGGCNFTGGIRIFLLKTTSIANTAFHPVDV